MINVPHVMYMFWDITLRQCVLVPEVSRQRSGYVKGASGPRRNCYAASKGPELNAQ